ncbi:penicillin-binding transpeptidase domain-containing protein [Rhodococcus sp. IEGM 1366]|uniref:penicillin-binding transpeptidase domain-containing protein n=1 Tax=Rhodococcus sp. IEGM 1366 TaxID=3082223 RepID=UPI00295405AB|nr:penicillin-binding transpeptidase domain-containing protein [Rhodococcus sp. IEGM 1366]MDV8065584.1 penicillin-binding transpeptidase domain-containing protein [Rhodococcus sp. IEGM 1366]
MTATHEEVDEKVDSTWSSHVSKSTIVWASIAVAAALVARPAELDLWITLGLTALLSFGCCLAVSASGAAALQWTGTLCALTVIGAMAQIRLGASPIKVAVTCIAAAAIFVVVVRSVRRRISRDLLSFISIAVYVAIGCVLLRVVIPIVLGAGDFTYLLTGTIGLPGTGLAIQVGEFTRIGLVASVGVTMWGVAQASGDSSASTVPRWKIWVITPCFLGYLVVLAAVDNGPAVLTVIGVVTIAILIFGPARLLSATWRKLRSPIGLGAVAVFAALVVLAASQVDDFATRAPGRFLSLLDPNEQMRAGFQAMQRGGLLGSGMGTSPFATGVPIGESDLLPAVLAADLGMAVMAALGIVLLVTLAAITVRTLATDGYWAVLGTALAVMLLVQAAWPLLANVGILPLSGISVPFLVVTVSALLPVTFSVAIAIGVSANSEPTTALRRQFASAIGVFRTVVSATLTIAILVLALFISPVSDAAQIFMPRGKIVTSDGKIIATTADDGRRSYPGGQLYAEVGLVHRDGAQYAVESVMADELTCGGTPSILDRILVVVRPAPCTPSAVVTTLDSHLQEAAAESLNGLSGSVAVLDSQTGMIRALYSSDDIVPDEFRSEDLPSSPPLMAARQEPAALGSVFKIVTATAGLLEGVDMSDAPREVFSADGETLQNFDKAICPSTSVEDMLTYSCNTSAAFIGVTVGQDRLDEISRKYFGAGANIATDIGSFAIAGIDTGMGEKALTDMQVGRSAIGQEGATGNALSMSVVTASVVRSSSEGMQGTSVPAPQLIEGVCKAGNLVYESSDLTVGEPLPTAVADRVMQGMRGAAVSGTARTLEARGHSLAAKTGTADTNNAGFPVNSWVSVVIDSRWVLTVLVHTSSDVEVAATGVANKVLAQFPSSFSTGLCPN